MNWWTDGRTNIAKTFVTCNSLHIPNHILFSSPSTHVHLLILIIYRKRKHQSGKQMPTIYNKQMWTSLSESIATLSEIHKHSHSHSHSKFSYNKPSFIRTHAQTLFVRQDFFLVSRWSWNGACNNLWHVHRHKWRHIRTLIFPT